MLIAEIQIIVLGVLFGGTQQGNTVNLRMCKKSKCWSDDSDLVNVHDYNIACNTICKVTWYWPVALGYIYINLRDVSITTEQLKYFVFIFLWFY